MTVPELDFHSTDSLVSPLTFYPAEIHVSHHQLRNFISTTYEDKIVFVHDHDVFILDLEKHQRYLIATVPFEARCLAASCGWVCVGGESKGNCAFVRLGEGDSAFGTYGHDLVVETLGKEIVNSMTIHQIPGKTAEHPKEIVVLISNNDKTVTLYSLSQQEVLCVLSHPVFMNYASMSPDSTMIAAVGDSNEVYFYRRQEIVIEDDKRSVTPTYREYRWKQFAVPEIPAGEGVHEDYSFAVAFSPTGQYCAVSAQGGAISIFDMNQLGKACNNADAENAILCTFKSSRASVWGCVRSLSFSPEPWDLLAWTEDHGTIGVADIRRSFVRRQRVPLDRDNIQNVRVENTTASEFCNMDVSERLKHQYMQRLRASRGHPPVGARSLDDLRRHQNEATPTNRQTLDLDAREQSVIEALQTTIDDENYSPGPYSVNYTSPPSIRPPVDFSELRREYDTYLLNSNTMQNNNPAPRRRGSVVLSESTAGRHLLPPEPNRAMMTASPSPMSEDSTSTTPPMSTNDLTPSSTTSSQPMPYNIPPSDPWHVIEAHLHAERAAERNATVQTSPPRRPASLAQIEAAIYAERQLSNRLERQLADERRLSALLRTELEARERLLEARQQEIRTQLASDNQHLPSMEQVRQEQLQSEQESGRQRSNEIENEILSNSQRVERLMAERDLLLLQAMDNHDRASLSSMSFTVPTFSAQATENEELEMVLRQMEEERRTRRQRIHDLELQVRRAESRVETASARSLTDQSRDRNERVSDARFLAASTRSDLSVAGLRRAVQMDQRAQQMDQYGVPFGSRTAPSTSSAYTSRLRAAAVARRAEAALNNNQSTLARTTELAGRVSENDMRIARSMLRAALMDANGNWVPGHTSRRTQAQAARSTNGGNLPARSITFEDILREGGVGTAGIGWSRDGTHLYAGSECGIFEFKVNMKDRMQFPSLELR